MLGFDAAREGSKVGALVGYMPEHDCLPPELSATEFVTHMGEMAGLPRTASRERTADVLRHVGLYEERYRPIGGYSTGMKQRVKLAQALVHDPRLRCSTSRRTASTPRARRDAGLVRRIGNDTVSRPSSPATSSARSSASAPAGGDRRRPPPALRTHRDFTERTGVLSVEVEEGAEALAAALTAGGLTAHLDGRTVLVEAHDERPYDLVRDRIVNLGLALVRLEQRRGSLEDLFSDEATDAA